MSSRFTSSVGINRPAKALATPMRCMVLAAIGLFALSASTARAVDSFAQGTMTVDANSAVTGAFDTVDLAPEIAASANTDWPAGTTFTLTAPTHFVFDTTIPASAIVQAPGDLTLANGGIEIPAANTIVFTVTVASTIPSTVEFPDLRLRAVDCIGGTVGDAADILLTVTPGPGGSTVLVDVPLVDVTVVPGATGAPNAGLDHFDVSAAPLIQVAGSPIVITLTARDLCDNPIPNFAPESPITITATGGAAIRTFASGGAANALTINDNLNNTATIPVLTLFDANGQGTFEVTSPTGEDPPITIAATLGAAAGSVDVQWITASCLLSPSGILRPVNTLHAVTATLTQNGGTPVAGVDVTFSVTAGPNLGAGGVVATNALGQATFVYAGGPNTGIDTIQATGLIGAVPFICTDPNAVEWISPTCSIAALPPTAAGGAQLVAVDVERRPGVDAPDGTPVTLTILSGPNAGHVDVQPTAAGIATFNYNDVGGAGLDTLRASGSIAGAAFECIQTKEWIQPTCMLDPPADVNAVNSVHSVDITLLRRPGVPAAGVTVTIDVTAGPNAAVAPQMIMTDAAGHFVAPFLYMGGATAGTDTITASGTIDGVAFMCEATKEWIDSGCAIDPFSDTNQAGTDHTVTVTVLRTTSPDPAVNAIVNFTVSGINVDAGVGVTDVNGQASFTYTSNGTPGLDTIEADTVVDGVDIHCEATKEWIDAQCSIDPPTDTNPVGTIHQVTVTVTENGGVPAPVVAVNFEIVSGPNAPFADADITNLIDGTVTFSYPSNGNPGTDEIRVFGTIGGPPGGADFECTATKTWEVVPSCVIAPMAPSIVGGMQTVNVDVESGPGLDAPDGTIVNFVVLAGPNVLAGGSDTTTAGAADFTYMSNGLAGVDTIRANGTINGVPFECLAIKEWIDPTCELDPPTDVNRVNTAHEVNITLLRRPGVPAAGVSVTIDVTAGPNAAAVAPQMILTDAAGQFAAPFQYMGGPTPGTDTITASGTIDGVAFNCEATKEWVDSGCLIDPFTDTNQVGEDHTVTVTVLRTEPPDTPAVNAIVNFTVTGTNNAAGVGVTDVNGQASFTYTSNGTPGTDTIAADTVVDGVDVHCEATKEWIDVGCDIVPLDDTNLVGTLHNLTISVTKDGAPAANQLVAVNILAGPNAGFANFVQTGPLNGNPAGQASLSYLSNGNPGTDTIRASGTISGVPFQCEATKTWISASCSLAPAADTNQENTQHTVTITVLKNGAPAPGIDITYNIISGPNTGLVLMNTTNGAGHSSFTYTGAGGPGTDTIQATGEVDGVPILCTATKTWVPDDDDNISPDEEDECPNNGDGNSDGIPDSLQDNVACFRDIYGEFVTIVSPAGTRLTGVMALLPPDEVIVPPDVTFPRGFFKFNVEGIFPVGSAIVVDMIMHSDPAMNTYYKFGPSPVIPVDHYYSFLFDGTTGAEIADNVVHLHLVDGMRGDHDLEANGIIVEPGAPGLQADNPAPITPSASCGLCGAVSATSMLAMLLGMMGIRFSRRRERGSSPLMR
ncbi:MAG TPA: Ig-like domain-containing protein [Phycisphaerae bacterium]|nr:Ig-like domain-containing protein [Phycisphaerae bacterium]